MWLEVTSLFTLHLHQVSSGLDSLLFNLLVLGVLSDSRGRVWRRRPCDLYIVEVTTGGTECKTQSQAVQAGVSANVWSLFVCLFVCLFVPVEPSMCYEPTQKITEPSELVTWNRREHYF